MISVPNPRLKTPAANRIPLLANSNLFAVKCKGRPTKKLIAIIPPIEPIPKIKIYSNAREGEAIVGTTSNINAALPARPCTIPTAIERALKRWCEVSACSRACE
jgi:hypothetical protein